MNKTRFYLLVVCVTVTLASSIYGQSRSLGHLTVPLGWENRDSVRFSLWGLFEWEPWKDGYRANLEMDSALANSIGDFGIIPLNYAPIGLRVGGAIASAGTGTVLDAMRSIKQRIFYPFPKTTALWGSCLKGRPLQWNYIDPSAMYHTWMYETNDISPYAEFHTKWT
jgi:hypothetical protein